MARRALRKLNPLVDLSSWLISADETPKPWSTEALFGRRGELEIEVGSGKGLFLASAAERAPETLFLGIEVSRKYAAHVAMRLARRNLASAKVMHGDALAFFRELPSNVVLRAVHVYFPDPWWKARHKKRRVMNEGFVRDVERVLAPGGSLHFWTDVEEYFLATLALIERATCLTGPHAIEERPAESDLDYHTHFERRTRLSGLPVFRAQFRRAPLESTSEKGASAIV